ncbi:hypothetical protein GGF42_006879 [Coemansia sp. RSA 2424]|nr:hypothetical protein GGF42_006879 [Coemansia sp. RSA 2424]
MSALFFRRTFDMGPESPAVLIPQAKAILDAKSWQFFLAYGFGGSLCGVMALFLIGVYFWRPVLVNRVSLRLIFAISIYDFIECVLQATARSDGVSARCRATMFFSAFFGYASVYTSSSIALNLHLTLFRRGSRLYLPAYVEYLYFIVPLVVSLLHWAPPAIWAAVHGYCSAFEPIDIGTSSYIRYVVFVQLLLPLLALLFNVVTSLRVIIMLLVQQRQVNRSLQEVMQNTRKHVLCSSNSGNGTNTYALAEDDGCGYASTKATKELEVNLMVVRKFNNAAIRIALYPCAPIAWWCINLAFYVIQYSLTMTYQADVATFVRMVSLAWFSMPAIAFANFLVFVTDPALRKVVKEVQRSIVGLSKLLSKQAHGTSERKYSELYQDTVHSNLSTLCKPGTVVHVKEAGDATSSTDRSSFESDYRPPVHERPSNDGEDDMEPSARSTAVLSAYNKLIRRHPTVGNSVDANLAYSKI